MSAPPVVAPLARASHLPPTLAVTAYTTAIALRSGRRRGAAVAGVAALAGQLAVGWSNDYLDRHRDREAGRRDKPIATGDIDAEVVRRAAILAGVACVPLSLLSGWRAASVHGVAVAAAVEYNRHLKTTVASVVPYVVAFGALPAFVTLGGPAHRWPSASVMTAGALMGAGAHFVNTLPDFEADALTGVRGLPHRLGRGPATVIGVGLLGAATVVVATAGDEPLRRVGRCLAVAAAASVAGVVAASATGRRRAAWMLTLATSAATVALFLSRGELLDRTGRAGSVGQRVRSSIV